RPSLTRSLFLLSLRRAPRATLFPYTTLFRSRCRAAPPSDVRPALRARAASDRVARARSMVSAPRSSCATPGEPIARLDAAGGDRSEEHTSELQSLAYLVCRLLLEKKKQQANL